MSIKFSRLMGAFTVLMLFVWAALSGTSAQAGPLAQATAAPTRPAAVGKSACASAAGPADLSAETAATTPAPDATMEATMNAVDMAATQTAVPLHKFVVFTDSGCLITAPLLGSDAVPTAGPADASGRVFVSINAATGQVCYDIHIQGITLPAAAAYIHRGEEGVAGPVVVTLTPPDANGYADGCIQDVDKGLLGEILGHPEGFYVDVDTSDFPTGAVRGGLGTAAKLLGANDVPPGDPNGVGSVSLDISAADGNICWDISVSNIDLQDFHVHAYIHEGQRGEVGPAVVDLTEIDPTGESNGCYPNRIVNAAETLPDILAHPDNYYVEIVNTEFPKGAIRGQISGN